MKVRHIEGHLREIPQDVQETRTVSFIISTPTRDAHKTVIDTEGWDFSRYEKNPVVAYQHNLYGDGFTDPNPDYIIGTGRVSVQEGRLIGDVTFETADINPLAEKIFKKVLHGSLRATSVGFLPLGKGHYGEGDEGRGGERETYYIGKRQLLEFSIVNVPSNPDAVKRDFDELISEETKDTVDVPTNSVPETNRKSDGGITKINLKMGNKILPGTLKGAYEKRNEINAELKSWSERVAAGLEKMDDEEGRKLDRLLSEQSEIQQHIVRLELLERANFDQAKQELDKKIEKKVEIDKEEVFKKMLRYGESGLNPEERATLVRDNNIVGQRAVTDPQSTTTTAGGYLIPYGFNAAIDIAMKPYASVLEAATILETGEGNDIYWPTVDDTSITGHLLTEGSQDTVYNVTFGQVTLKAYMFTSYIVKCPLQLLQDSAVNIESLLAQLLGERLGRILANYFTNGTNSSQPQGILYSATDSAVVPSATAITRDDIIELKHSVNALYRNAPGAAFMFNDTTFKLIAKLTFGTSDDRPLWQPSIVTGQPDMIEGKRYFINDYMGDVEAEGESMLFGDLKKFLIRRVLGTTMFVYREKYMDYLQIGFQAYNRWDSKIIDAGQHPIKKLVHPAS